MTAIFDIALLASTIRLFTPILLAALGGMFSSRTRIFNIALEGLMLISSFLAVAGVFWTQNPYFGLALGVLGATIMAMIYAFFVVAVKGNAIIIGLAVNIFALGATTFSMRLVFGVAGGYYDPSLVGLPNIALPVIDSIPVLRDVLSGHSIIVYASWIITVLSYFLLFRHPIGIHMRAVGEDPVAAGSVGISVKGMKYLSMLLCGVLCGLAGAQLSISLVTQFVQGMTAGRGFIALVAAMFGREHPFGVFGASLLFGFAYAASLRLQGVGIPTQFVNMLPYVATILVLVAMQMRARVRTAS